MEKIITGIFPGNNAVGKEIGKPLEFRVEDFIVWGRINTHVRLQQRLGSDGIKANEMDVWLGFEVYEAYVSRACLTCYRHWSKIDAGRCKSFYSGFHSN